MRRYFFDFVGNSQKSVDFHGYDLPTTEKAVHLAELIALDQSMRGDRIGWNVSVFDARGNKYFSVPVQDPELAAA